MTSMSDDEELTQAALDAALAEIERLRDVMAALDTLLAYRAERICRLVEIAEEQTCSQTRH